jgi:hypothetical protein
VRAFDSYPNYRISKKTEYVGNQFSSGVEIPTFTISNRFQPVIKPGKRVLWTGDIVRFESSKKLLTIGPPYYDFDRLSEINISEGAKREFHKFLISLKIWETIPVKRPLDASFYWELVVKEGPSCYKRIKDIFEYSLRYSYSVTKLNLPDKEYYKIDSYDAIFPYVHLPLFREDDPKDYLYALTESEYDEGELENFRYELQQLLEDVPKIERVLDEEILDEINTSSSYDDKRNRIVPHWQLNFDEEHPFSDEIRAVRKLVPVAPCSYRDTIITNRESNNSVRWCERQLRHVLEYIPESAVTKRSSTMLNRKSRVVNKRGYHIWRDFKKCGLTNNPG